MPIYKKLCVITVLLGTSVWYQCFWSQWKGNVYKIHHIFSLAQDWSKCVTWLNIPQLKVGNIRAIVPNFNITCVEKNIWRKRNTIASIWHKNMLSSLSFRHYHLLEAHSFLQALLLLNCSLLGIDVVHVQISKHIFAPKEGYCLHLLWTYTLKTRKVSPEKNCPIMGFLKVVTVCGSIYD